MFFLHSSQAKVNAICALRSSVLQFCCAPLFCLLLTASYIALQPDDSKMPKILSLAVLRAFTRSGRMNIIASTTNVIGTTKDTICYCAPVLLHARCMILAPWHFVLCFSFFSCLLLRCSASHPLLQVLFASLTPGVTNCHNSDALLIVLSTRLSFLHRSGLTVALAGGFRHVLNARGGL